MRSIQYFTISGISNVSSYYNIVDGTTTNNMAGPCINSSESRLPDLERRLSQLQRDWLQVGREPSLVRRARPHAPCIREYLSGMSDTTFNCDLSRYGGGNDFNSTGANTGNLRADPHFVKRGGTVPRGLRAHVGEHGLSRRGRRVLHGVECGSGNTVNVTCSGLTTDPRFYFPQPSDYYDLSNDECKGKGTRVGDSANPGCYDIEIAGACGVRQITSMTATSITFSGASCSWASGAMVHIPWEGNAPDVGAMEGFSSGVHAPVLLEVVPTNGRSGAMRTRDFASSPSPASSRSRRSAAPRSWCTARSPRWPVITTSTSSRSMSAIPRRFDRSGLPDCRSISIVPIAEPERHFSLAREGRDDGAQRASRSTSTNGTRRTRSV